MMKDPLKCNGCAHNQSMECGYTCSACKDGSMFKPRQKIRYGSDLDPYSAAKKAVEEYCLFKSLPEIKDVIFNNSATIVFWADDTKTVVKAVNEEFDPEKGLAMAIAKKALGNKGNYFNTIKKWSGKYPNKDKSDG